VVPVETKINEVHVYIKGQCLGVCQMLESNNKNVKFHYPSM